jgi:acyl carrier protein
MDRTEIINTINEALAEEFEIEISMLVPDANIIDTLEIDSLGLVDMVTMVESLFDVEIRTRGIASIQTFENLYDYIERNMIKKGQIK